MWGLDEEKDRRWISVLGSYQRMEGRWRTYTRWSRGMAGVEGGVRRSSDVKASELAEGRGARKLRSLVVKSLGRSEMKWYICEGIERVKG